MRCFLLKGFIVTAVCLLLTLRVMAAQPMIQHEGPLADGDFKVLFTPVHGLKHPVNQDIHFTVRANQPFYLQLFARNSDGRLLPILRQDGTAPRKYQANTEFRIPDSRSHFQTACPGSQKVLMVASPSPLPAEKGESAPPALTTRGAYLVEEQAARVEQEIELEITAIKTVQVALYAPQSRYRLGEYIPVTVTAPANGFVNIWLVNPDKSDAFLGRRQVQANRKLTLTFRADPPVGTHRIVARYDQSISGNTSAPSLAAAGYGKCQGADGFSELILEIEAEMGEKDAPRGVARVTDSNQQQNRRLSSVQPAAKLNNDQGSVTMWNDLRNLIDSAPHLLTLTLNRQRYTVGDQLMVNCRVDRPGYLNIFSLSKSATEAVLIFPNSFQRNNRIEADKTVRVPSRGASFRLTARPPLGEVMVAALLTEQPMDLRRDNIKSVNQLFAALQPSAMRSLTLVDGFASLLAGGRVMSEIQREP